MFHWNISIHSLKEFSRSFKDAIDDPSASIDGDDTPTIEDIPGSIILWEASPRPTNSADYYQFTTFAMSLNELTPEIEKVICPTDSRLRPDIRKLENGDQDGAAAEKMRLEEKQRDTRKSRKHKKGDDWTPRWFQLGMNPYTNQMDWLYRGGYWDRGYGNMEDIF